MELTNTTFLPDPNTKNKRMATFEWFDGGEFLILRQGSKEDGMPWATWFIGRDNDYENYTVLYLGDKQSSGVYEMSYENWKWKIWCNDPELTQRFSGEVNADFNLIKGCWEKSTDGKTWNHDFDLTCQRARQNLKLTLFGNEKASFIYTWWG